MKRRRWSLCLLTFLPQVIFSCDSLQHSLVTVTCLIRYLLGVTRYNQGTCLQLTHSIFIIFNLDRRKCSSWLNFKSSFRIFEWIHFVEMSPLPHILDMTSQFLSYYFRASKRFLIRVIIAILAGVVTIISAIVCHLLEIQVVIDPDQLIVSLPVSCTFITPGHKIV